MEFALSTLKCHNSTLKCQAKEAGSPLKLHRLISVITVGKNIIKIPNKVPRKRSLTLIRSGKIKNSVTL